MRARDILIAFSLPFILLFVLYFYARGPQVYRPEKSIARMHGGQNLTIVFLGNSITAGYGEQKNYFYQFRMILKGTTAFDRTRVINAGVPGNTSADGLVRLDTDVISQKPDLVYIEFGGNDLRNRVPLSEFENNMRSMVRRIQASGHPDIILMTLPVFDIPLTKKVLEQYNQVIRKVAKETGVGCLDIYKTFKKEIGWTGSASTYMQDDHIHPNEQGHKLIFQQIWRTLE